MWTSNAAARAQSQGIVCIMFTDLVGSTQMTHERGDYGAQEVVHAHNAIVRSALAEHHGRDLPWSFNRKEAKDHGEGGNTVGAPLRGRVLIVDDVISAGTSSRESVEIIRAAGAQAVGVAISLDRQERGQGQHSAIEEIRSTLGLQVISIATLAQLIAFVEHDKEFIEQAPRLSAYRAEYGSA